jgi:prepilin-type N-terminal cleavage/methylation domain-containing protein
MGRINSSPKTNRGFTLLEILVVVILIAMGATMISIAIGGDHYEEEARKEAQSKRFFAARLMVLFFTRRKLMKDWSGVISGNVSGMRSGNLWVNYLIAVCPWVLK